MAMVKRRVVSVEQVTDMLDKLAEQYQLTNHCYDESAAESITSDFDALTWRSLCAQRAAIHQREMEAAQSRFQIPSPLRGLYESKPDDSPKHLKNSEGRLNKLAA